MIFINPNIFNIVEGGGGVGNGFEAEYNAILDEAILQGYGLPSETQQKYQNYILKKAKQSGFNIWGNADVILYLSGDGSKEFKRINWKNPSGPKAQEVGAGALIWDTDGVKGDAVNYLNTNFKPLTQGVNFTQNNASVWMDVVELSNGVNVELFKDEDNTNNNFAKDTELMRPRLNDGSTLAQIFTIGTKGLFGIMRPSSVLQKFSLELGSETNDIDSFSAALRDVNFCLFGNNQEQRGTSKLGFFMASSNLSGAQSEIINTLRYSKEVENPIYSIPNLLVRLSASKMFNGLNQSNSAEPVTKWESILTDQYKAEQTNATWQPKLQISTSGVREVNFDGTDILDFGNDAFNFTNTDDFSIALVTGNETFKQGFVYCKGWASNTSTVQYGMVYYGTTLEFHAFGQATTVTKTWTAEPHLIVMTYNGTTKTMSVYADGVFLKSFVTTGSYINSTGLTFGCNFRTSSKDTLDFGGQNSFREFMVFDKELSETERTTIFNNVNLNP